VADAQTATAEFAGEDLRADLDETKVRPTPYTLHLTFNTLHPKLETRNPKS